MKTKILAIVLALSAAVSFAEDFQYLYWMVDLPSDSEYTFSYATVKSGSTTFEVYDEQTQTPVGTQVSSDDGKSTGYPVYVGNVAGCDGLTFVFELWNESNERVAWQSVAYSYLWENSHIGKTMSSEIKYFTVAAVTPEPTSGMLLLLGIAGLALKRKRA